MHINKAMGNKNNNWQLNCHFCGFFVQKDSKNNVISEQG